MKTLKRTQFSCEYCQKQFMRFDCHMNKSLGRFCSRKCYYKSRWILLNCDGCSNLFSIKRFCKIKREKQGSVRGFCNRECYHFYHESKKIIKTCLICNNHFKLNPWASSSYRFCSSICKSKEDQKRKNGRNYRNGAALYRVISREAWGERCHVCQSEEKIEVHHIDRDRNNNTQANLRPLCSKCHHAIHDNLLCLILERHFWLRRIQGLIDRD